MGLKSKLEQVKCKIRFQGDWIYIRCKRYGGNYGVIQNKILKISSHIYGLERGAIEEK